MSMMLVDSDTDPMAIVKERLLSSSELLVAQFEVASQSTRRRSAAAEERPW